MPAKKMDRPRMEALLDRAYYARLATAAAEFPYIVPLCFLYREGKIYIHSRQSGKKIDEISAKGRVCIQIDEIKGLVSGSQPCSFNVAYESVIIQGEAGIITDPFQKEIILNLLAQKYSGGKDYAPLLQEDIGRTAVVEINIRTISGKSNPV